MRSQYIALASAGLAAATHPALEPLANLNKRDEQACLKAATEWLPTFTDVPEPPAGLQEYAQTQTQVLTITDPCVVPHVTGDMADEYTSYISELSSWYDEAQDGISSILKACSDVPAISEQLASVTESVTLCEKLTFADETGGSSNNKPAETSGASSNSGSSNDDKPNAATGLLASGLVAVAAAIMGAAMVL